MKKNYKINYDKLWSPSGDPFVDAGGYALKCLSKHFPDKDLMELIMFVAEIYIDKWDSKIDAFFLNSNITQHSSSFTSQKKKIATEAYFRGLLTGSESHTVGVCRILGIVANLYPTGRNSSVMTGSGKFVNFHHSFEQGLMVSAEALVRYHFLPLGCELLSGNVSVINSNKILTSQHYVSKCVEKNLMYIGQGASTGVLKNSSRSCSTAIFRYVDNILSDLQCEEDEFITLYHFTNFASHPDLNIYSLPFESFFFYRESQKSIYRDGWNAFVKRYYKNSEYKEVRYNSEYSTYVGKEKKQDVVINEEVYQYWYNTIYDDLIKGKSILPEIRKWSKENVFHIDLLRCYLQNILKMKRETIEKLSVIADFILSNTEDSRVKKVLTTLDGIKSPSLLRRFILKIVEQNYALGNEYPIITVEDYTDYLFPDTESWKEVRDVLIIYIYQKLHANKVVVNVDFVDEIIDDDE